MNARAFDVARQNFAEGVFCVGNEYFRALCGGFFDKFQFRLGAVGAFSRRAFAEFFVFLDVFGQFICVFARDLFDEGGRIVRIGINTVYAREDEQGLGFDEAGDERCRFVVVHALVDFCVRSGKGGDLHSPVFRFGHCVVIVDDGNGILFFAAKK